MRAKEAALLAVAAAGLPVATVLLAQPSLILEGQPHVLQAPCALARVYVREFACMLGGVAALCLAAAREGSDQLQTLALRAAAGTLAAVAAVRHANHGEDPPLFAEAFITAETYGCAAAAAALLVVSCAGGGPRGSRPHQE